MFIRHADAVFTPQGGSRQYEGTNSHSAVASCECDHRAVAMELVETV